MMKRMNDAYKDTDEFKTLVDFSRSSLLSSVRSEFIENIKYRKLHHESIHTTCIQTLVKFVEFSLFNG